MLAENGWLPRQVPRVASRHLKKVFSNGFKQKETDKLISKTFL